MKYSLVILVSMMMTLSVSAQKDSMGVVVHKDPRIDMLVKKQIEYNEVTTRESRRFIQGFRILVLNTKDNKQATDTKQRLYQEFPELRGYLQWQAPFFKVKVGDFKTRAEADEYLEHIKRVFPTGVYVVRDTIEVNPDKSGEIQ